MYVLASLCENVSSLAKLCSHLQLSLQSCQFQISKWWHAYLQGDMGNKGLKEQDILMVLWERFLYITFKPCSGFNFIVKLYFL